MNRILTAVLVLSAMAAGVTAAQDKAPSSPLSDKDRVDALIKQNQLLLDENARLNGLPKTREQAFAVCMQAAKGTGAMAAESIGEHCKQVLRSEAPACK